MFPHRIPQWLLNRLPVPAGTRLTEITATLAHLREQERTLIAEREQLLTQHIPHIIDALPGTIEDLLDRDLAA
jgi:hypothetical protein